VAVAGGANGGSRVRACCVEWRRCVCSWYTIELFHLNVFVQPETLQRYGCSPVCRRMCTFKLCHRENTAPHPCFEHTYCFSRLLRIPSFWSSRWCIIAVVSLSFSRPWPGSTKCAGAASIGPTDAAAIDVSGAASICGLLRRRAFFRDNAPLGLFDSSTSASIIACCGSPVFCT